jgi:hypothetical protein
VQFSTPQIFFFFFSFFFSFLCAVQHPSSRFSLCAVQHPTILFCVCRSAPLNSWSSLVKNYRPKIFSFSDWLLSSRMTVVTDVSGSLRTFFLNDHLNQSNPFFPSLQLVLSVTTVTTNHKTQRITQEITLSKICAELLPLAKLPSLERVNSETSLKALQCSINFLTHNTNSVNHNYSFQKQQIRHHFSDHSSLRRASRNLSFAKAISFLCNTIRT